MCFQFPDVTKKKYVIKLEITDVLFSENSDA
jgi:hypothetical protein